MLVVEPGFQLHSLLSWQFEWWWCVKYSFYRTRVRSLVILVSDSLTNSCLVNLIDVTLACEDTNSKLVDIVTVANVDDEDCIGNSLLQIWELRIVHKAKLLFRLWSNFKVEVQAKFEAGVWSVFCC